MKNTSVCVLLWLLMSLLACAKPDRVVRVNSADQGVFFTVETVHGQGAISNDFTRIYAHLENGNKSDQELVLDGEYLEETKITWLNPGEVTLCVPDGSTDTFRNLVTLSAGGRSQTVRTHLRENCADNLIPGSQQYNDRFGNGGNPPRLQRK